MKNYFKKFGVIFLIIFAVIGIQDSFIASATTVGDVLEQPEEGWNRYDDNNEAISYSTAIDTLENSKNHYGGSAKIVYCQSIKDTQYVKFTFYGTKIRIIDSVYHNWTQKSTISIDNGEEESCTGFRQNNPHYYNAVYYEKLGLNEGYHDVIIKIPVDKETDSRWFLDCIDIDDNGALYQYGTRSVLSLDKTTTSLIVGETDNIVATFKPEHSIVKGVKWTSSDETIATVDENGKVTALKEGTAEVIATIENDNLSAKCIVTVIKDPMDQYKNSAIITLTLKDGIVKTYDVSAKKLGEFLNWYDARSNGSGRAYFVFEGNPLGGSLTNKDYIPFDEIRYFNVKEYKPN